jgi:hypothetical protein
MIEATLDFSPIAGGEQYIYPSNNAEIEYKDIKFGDDGTYPISNTLVGGTAIHTSNNTQLLQTRLSSRRSMIMEEAIRARLIFPDPVQSLIDLFGSIPGDYDTWIEVIEEPYG